MYHLLDEFLRGHSCTDIVKPMIRSDYPESPIIDRVSRAYGSIDAPGMLWEYTTIRFSDIDREAFVDGARKISDGSVFLDALDGYLIMVIRAAMEDSERWGLPKYPIKSLLEANFGKCCREPWYLDLVIRYNCLLAKRASYSRSLRELRLLRGTRGTVRSTPPRRRPS